MSTISDAEREMFGDPDDALDYCERCRGYRVAGHRCELRDQCPLGSSDGWGHLGGPDCTYPAA